LMIYKGEFGSTQILPSNIFSGRLKFNLKAILQF